MKLFTFLALITSTLLLLTSCLLGGESMENNNLPREDKIANARLEEIIKSIEYRDKQSLKKMFSKWVIKSAPNIEEQIELLFDFFQGEMVSYDDWGGPQSSVDIDAGKISEVINSTYNIETTDQKYRICVREYVKNTFDPEKVGVESFSIIKEEDANEYYAYWTTGIGIVIDDGTEE